MIHFLLSALLLLKKKLFTNKNDDLVRLYVPSGSKDNYDTLDFFLRFHGIKYQFRLSNAPFMCVYRCLTSYTITSAVRTICTTSNLYWPSELEGLLELSFKINTLLEFSKNNEEIERCLTILEEKLQVSDTVYFTGRFSYADLVWAHLFTKLDTQLLDQKPNCVRLMNTIYPFLDYDVTF